MDKAIPGPGTYSIPAKIGNEASKYSLRGRNLNHRKLRSLTFIVMLTTVRQNPGPGAYDPPSSLQANGKYFEAKLKNSGAPTFSLPSLQRFKEKLDYRPGPGAYNLKVGISDSTSFYLSTFTSPKTRTFYHSDRKTIDITKDAKSKFYHFYSNVVIDLPGPGNYKMPSDFGHYEAKNSVS